MSDIVERLRAYDVEDRAYNVLPLSTHNFAFPPEDLIKEAADEIEALRHDIEAAQQVNTDLCNPWQPISTAPRDGKPILVWVPYENTGCYMIGRWANPSHNDIAYPDGAWDTAPMPQPTYWTNLQPPAPEQG